jgi:hypothetical protein
MLRMVFPCLWSPERHSTYLTQDEQTVIYERGIRPTVAQLMPQDLSDWPATFNGEMFRARTLRGGLALTTKAVASWNVWRFGESLKRNLEESGVEWARGMIYAHQVRGMKHATQHTVSQEAAGTSLEEFLHDMAIDIPNEEQANWWIDVGLELCALGHCLQWRTDSHFHVFKAISAIDSTNAERATSLGSKKYHRDLSAHFTGLSGCRIEPGVRAAGRHDIKYFQMYTTDKSITYRTSGGQHAIAIQGSQAIKAGSGNPPAFCGALYKLYSEAREVTDSNARVEIRIPLSQATRVLVSWPDDLSRNSLVLLSRSDWWFVKPFLLVIGNQTDVCPGMSSYFDSQEQHGCSPTRAWANLNFEHNQQP